MADSQLERLHLLFEQALALSAAERGAFVAEACAADAPLRGELSSLLEAYERSSGYFENLAEHIVAPALAAFGDAGDVSIGDRIGHYEVLECVGSGGVGVVYKARDLNLDRPVALKLLPPRLDADATARARFVAEAKAASALDHPNIGVVHEIAESEAGRPFIAMAWYDGGTIEQKLARGPLPVPEALDLVMQLANALDAAHRAGIIHRDIKPSNVLVTTQGVAKLVDFGIAKITGMKLTQDGMTLGTVAYMSPEQANGEAVDHRSDLWSLGVVLHELLTGRRPFRAENERALVHAILHDEPTPPSKLRAEVPRELDRIVGRLLRKKPQKRYGNGAELAAALEATRRSSAAAAK